MRFSHLTCILMAPVGPMAIVLLVFLRLCQGMAAGGEIVGAFVFAIEAVESGNSGCGSYGKCFWSACCKSTGNLGTSLGRRFHVFCFKMKSLIVLCRFRSGLGCSHSYLLR